MAQRPRMALRFKWWGERTKRKKKVKFKCRVHKVLLKHSHADFTYCRWLIPCHSSGVLTIEIIQHAILKYLSAPFTGLLTSVDLRKLKKINFTSIYSISSILKFHHRPMFLSGFMFLLPEELTLVFPVETGLLTMYSLSFSFPYALFLLHFQRHFHWVWDSGLTSFLLSVLVTPLFSGLHHWIILSFLCMSDIIFSSGPICLSFFSLF